jgi:hypothetical protein
MRVSMVEPAKQDLYIMQNEFGLLKIGRSVDVERRRLKLQTSERCRISVVEVYVGCGDMEEDIHLDMDDYRLVGEWFDGSEEARMALCESVGCGVSPPSWPYDLDGERAAAWLNHIAVVRHAAAIRRELYRQIAILRTADGPSWVYDCGIFFVKWRAATGARPFLHNEKADGQTVTRWHDPDTGATGIVPGFTRDAETALMAWPDDLRPAIWDGSPVECCIAALSAIRSRLPEVPRQVA